MTRSLVTATSTSPMGVPQPNSPIDLTPVLHWIRDMGFGDLVLLAATVAAFGMCTVILHRLFTERLADALERWREHQWSEDAHEVVILAPRVVNTEGAVRLWSNLAGLLRRSGWRRLVFGAPHIALEYRWHARQLLVVLWVPGSVPVRDVATAVRAAWPGASAEVRPAAPPLPRAEIPAHEAGAWLRPTMANWYPLASTDRRAGGSSRDERAGDPLRAVLEVGAALPPQEQACLQVIARPATAGQSHRLRGRAAGLPRSSTGMDLAADVFAKALFVLADIAFAVIAGIFDAILGGSSAQSTRPRTAFAPRTSPTSPNRAVRSGDPFHDRGTRMAVEKSAGPQWSVAVQIGITRSGGLGPQEKTQRHLKSRIRALAAALGVRDPQDLPNRLRANHLERPSTALAKRRLRRSFSASTQEVAALAGLPTDLAVPGLDRARARSAPVPVRVPSGGRNTKVLGRSLDGGHAVALPAADARQHLHVMGSTGTGKSTLLSHLILDDIRAGRGVVLIDPKGDLALDVLQRFPAQHVHRLTVMDPALPSGSAFLNPLEVRAGIPADVVVDNITSIFASIYHPHWGPRMDDVLRVCCLTLMRYPSPALPNVTLLLTDQQYRKRYTQTLSDPEGLSGFWKTFEASPEQLQAQTISPVLARLRSLMLRPFIRHTIGGSTSSFDMRDILDGGVLIARLPKGHLGEDAARLLGSLLLASVWQAALARSEVGEQVRRDASCYVDEAHGLLNLTGNMGDMLAEARGYRLSFVLAHQNLAQVPPEMQKGLSANARNKVFFTMSPEDASTLARHTEPELEAEDLSRLDAFVAAVRLIINGGETPSFTLRTRPPVEPGSGGIDLGTLRATVAARGPDASPASSRRPAASPDPDLQAYYAGVEEIQDVFGDMDEQGGQGLGRRRATPGHASGRPQPGPSAPVGNNPQARRDA